MGKKGLIMIALPLLIIGLTSCGISQTSNQDESTRILSSVDEIGNFDICAQELDQGASPNYAIKKGILGKEKVSLIKTSMDAHNIRMIEYLLKRGADPNYKFDKKKGATLLMYASGYENSGVSTDGVISYNNVKILLDYGANINELDQEGMSALDHSITSEGMNLGVNKVLLEGNIKISPVTIKSLNARLIINDQKRSVPQRIFEHFFPDFKEEQDKAIDFFDFESARQIYIKAQNKNIDLDVSAPMSEIVTGKDNGRTIKNINKLRKNELDAAMCFTACFGSADTMRGLIGLGGDMNQTGHSEGETLLSLAAKHHNQPMVKFLIEKGLDVNSKYGDLMTPAAPINRAAESGDLATMKLLLDNGANIVVAEPDDPISSDSTLCRAAIFGNTDVISLVIKIVGKKIKNSELLNACNEAIASNEVQCLKLLLEVCHERDYYPDDGLVGNAVTNSRRSPYVNLKMLKYLVENGAGVNGGDSTDSPIDIAVAQSEVASLEYLIKKGAKVNNFQKYDDGSWSDPCIFDAVMIGNLDIIKILVEAGAKLDYRNLDGETPIEHAQSFGNAYTVRYLRDKQV